MTEIATAVIIGVLVLGVLAFPVLLFAGFKLGDSNFGSGFTATDQGTNPCLSKSYGEVTVRFYTWGAASDSVLIDKSRLVADGVYAIISSPKALDLKYSTPLFDQVEVDNEKRGVAIAKKRGVFLSDPEMKRFLGEFDRLIRKDLEESA